MSTVQNAPFIAAVREAAPSISITDMSKAAPAKAVTKKVVHTEKAAEKSFSKDPALPIKQILPVPTVQQVAHPSEDMDQEHIVFDDFPVVDEEMPYIERSVSPELCSSSTTAFARRVEESDPDSDPEMTRNVAKQLGKHKIRAAALAKVKRAKKIKAGHDVASSSSEPPRKSVPKKKAPKQHPKIYEPVDAKTTRSGRAVLRPLEFWKNERYIYSETDGIKLAM